MKGDKLMGNILIGMGILMLLAGGVLFIIENI